MRKLLICLGVLTLTVIGEYGVAHAQGNTPEGFPSSTLCGSIPIEEKIEWLANKIVTDQVGESERKCYEQLSDKERSQVFEAMAIKRSVPLNDLAQMTNINKQAGIYAGWNQLVERIPFSAVFRTTRSVAASWQDNNCDSDSSDVDYVFRIDFPYAQSNPDSLRSFSQHLGVDAMLSYYQAAYGGIATWGDTTSGFVFTCLGGGGVSTAGGRQTVHDHLKMHDNN